MITSLFQASLAIRGGMALDAAIGLLLRHVAAEVRRQAPRAGQPLQVPASAYRDEPESLLHPALNRRLRDVAMRLAGMAGKPEPVWCSGHRYRGGRLTVVSAISR